MRHKILFFLILKVTVLMGQSSAIDSLEARLADSALRDSLRIEILNDLSREYLFVSISKATNYTQEALDLSLRTKSKRGEAYAYRNLASVFLTQELFYESSGYIERALVLFEQLGDSVGIGNCYLTRGHISRYQEDYQKSMVYQQKAVDIFRSKGLPERLGVSLHNLGEDQMLAGELVSARATTYEATSILEPLRNLSVLSSCYKVLGMIDFRELKFEEAERKFKKVLEISEVLGPNCQKVATTQALLFLARLAHRKGQDKEIQYLERAVQLDRENKYGKPLYAAYSQMVDFYSRKNDFSKVTKSLKELVVVQDRALSSLTLDKARLTEAAMKVLRTDLENKKLLVEQELQEQVIQNQRNQILGYVALVLVLVSATVFYYQANKRRSSMNETLISQKKIIEEKSIRLEELNEIKIKFFSIVSHDLRSPLTSLKGFVSLFQNNFDSLSKGDIQLMMSALNKELSNTLNLTDNLLTWARSQMQLSEVNPAAVVVNNLIKPLALLYGGMANKKDIQITVLIPEDLTVYADPNQVEFVLRNLMDNAVKFTPRQGVIKIVASQVDSIAIISVENSGKGIHPDAIKHLFTVGKNGRTQGTEGEKGTGLGLVLCKEFIEKNAGTIEVESELGRGSKFTIRLPLAG